MAQTSGAARRFKELAEQCLAEYNLDVWTAPDLITPRDVNRFLQKDPCPRPQRRFSTFSNFSAFSGLSDLSVRSGLSIFGRSARARSGWRRSQLFTTCPRFLSVTWPAAFMVLKTSPQPCWLCRFMAISSRLNGRGALGPGACDSNRAHAIFCCPGESFEKAPPLLCAAPGPANAPSATTAASSMLHVLIVRMWTPPIDHLARAIPRRSRRGGARQNRHLAPMRGTPADRWPVGEVTVGVENAAGARRGRR